VSTEKFDNLAPHAYTGSMSHEHQVKLKREAALLKEKLRELDLSQAELSRVAAVEYSTVNRWATGARPVPGLLWAYLELRQQVRELARKSGVLE
jgi:DNA-binding transcriptional regulator YiaG